MTELTAALPSILSALAAVGAVLVTGTRLWGRRAGLPRVLASRTLDGREMVVVGARPP